MPRVIIVGGGISGLSTAHYLLEKDESLDLLLVEGSDHLGGTMGTDIVDDFVFEWGPNGFLDNVPYTVDLVRSLGIEGRMRQARPASNTRFLYKSRRLYALPRGPLAFLRSSLLSLRGRLRVMLEAFQPRGPENVDESVATFGRRRLGDVFVRTFLDPLVTGIHAGDVERLSLASAFPRIAELEQQYGSLVRALRAKRRERAEQERSGGETAKEGGPAGPGGTLCSFARGMGELVGALEKRLGDRVRTSWKASTVKRQGNGYIVEGPNGAAEKADGVVLAVPAYVAASLLAASEPESSRALESIPYAPIAVVCLGFHREAVRDPLAGFGFLVPRDQGLRLLGSIWVSSIFPEHAPDDTVSLRCMIGGARDPDALNQTEQHLLELVLEELGPILGIDGEPITHRFYRYGRGIPQYNVGHATRIDRIERLLWDLPGLFITGNSYYGVGVNDCVREGKRKARAVMEYFR